MLIEDLLPGINLETDEVEFKKTLQEGVSKGKNDRLELGWLRELCAFANTKGGRIFVGVTDKNHEVIPLGHEEVDRIVSMVQRLAKEHIEPSLPLSFHPLPVPDTHPTCYVLELRIERSRQLPVVLKYKNFSSIYVRHFGSIVIASSEEIRSMIYNSESVPFDTPFTDISFEEKDFSYLFQQYEKTNGKKLTIHNLISIGFLNQERKLAMGALLFKDDCNDSRTLIRCTSFPGYDKGGVILDHVESYQGNLLKGLDFAVSYVRNHSIFGIQKENLGARKVSSYPERALTEALANAIGHRNYYIDGSQIEVDLFLDRLEVISPGSFVGGKWLKDEENLSAIPPLRRNNLICAVLHLFHYMDEEGSGFDKIEKDYEGYGPEYKPRATSNDQFFSLTLANVLHKGGLVSCEDIVPLLPVTGLKEEKEQRILEFCYRKARTANEIASFLHLTPSSYFRKNVLQRLVQQRYLLEFDDLRPVKYLTRTELVRPL